MNLFVGAGVLITVGYQNIGTQMCLLRSGFATQAVGTGILIHIGHIHVRAWGVAGVFNAGQTRKYTLSSLPPPLSQHHGQSWFPSRHAFTSFQLACLTY